MIKIIKNKKNFLLSHSCNCVPKPLAPCPIDLTEEKAAGKDSKNKKTNSRLPFLPTSNTRRPLVAKKAKLTWLISLRRHGNRDLLAWAGLLSGAEVQRFPFHQSPLQRQEVFLSPHLPTPHPNPTQESQIWPSRYLSTKTNQTGKEKKSLRKQ